VCGICGKLDERAPVRRELVEAMCDSIVHRGPSSQGVFLEDGVGLGIRRLAVIDLQAGDQPIFNEDESVVVVLNGEIYNFVELRAELEAAGHRFRTATDTEVIVHLYEEMGDACVERLRGMFAFALWDRTRRRLLLARDRLGKKPLFYAVRGDTLWFGSEPRALLQDEALPRDVDYQAIDSYLQLGYVPHPQSAFASLRKLPPAHTLSWHRGSVELSRYWTLSYQPQGKPLAESEMRALIREQLLEATRIRLRSDVPLGAFLSGGVDSTAVVAAMSHEASGRVKTFSIGFDVKSFDETPYAAEVARLFDTEHEDFTVQPDAMSILPKLVWHFGEPFADASAIPTFYLSEMTRRHVTVALTGDGGDESFAGYSRYLFHDVVRRFEWLPPRAATLAARALGRAVSEHSPLRPARQARWLAEALSQPLPERYLRTMALVDLGERQRLYAPGFMERLASPNGHSPVDTISALIAGSDGETRAEQLMDVDVQTYLAGDLLVKVDIASMAHSLEVRSPLLDHELMQTVASLPSSSKLAGTTGKRLLKSVVSEWVPERILERRKRGFSPPLADWLRGSLRTLPEEVLLDPAALERGLFREGRVRELIEEHQAGVTDHSAKLWALLQLELWLRTYVDGPRPAPLASLS
jgi:asparagine synthase (glutamine-hydrolysing)